MVDGLVEGLEFSGVVLVEQGEARMLERASGYANRAEEIPNTLGTRFGQASGSKTFTAVAVARLVDEGHFGFQTPMSECLELWPAGFDSSVTVHHLLTHTSGIPDYFEEEIEDDFEALWSELPMYSIRGPSDLLPLFADLPMKSTPGEGFAYSNGGFVLLGLLIEQHTGKRFSEFIETEVFAPADMKTSGYFDLDRLPRGTALNYLTDENPVEPRTNLYAVPVAGQPDGGAFVTASDMASFWTALGEGRLLGKTTTAELLKRHIATGPDGGAYGYGVWIEDRDGALIHHAEGGDPGLNFLSGVWLEGESTVTVISNTDGGVWSIYDAIVTAITS